MKKNNSKKTYQLVKDLTSTKQGRTTTIQDKDGKCLTEEQDMLKRWSEYCSKLYNYRAMGDQKVLSVPPATENDNYPILREEVEAAVKSLKKGKSAGADNVPAELVQAGGEAMISLADLVERLDKIYIAFGMKLKAEKTKLITNITNGISTAIRVNGEKLDCVNRLKYLGAIIAQATAALAKIKTIWNDRNIALSSKIRLMRSLVMSIFLNACES
ncbi:hypothetical protein NP493_232g03018 [Ridgeia piscesae]|uniref:Uncharacterized protein n=1 Tax=Ridgeia piscesae TaxID=27915 RepID=A0AAD9NZS5_RIDPI|nr:hypothetical protein NP493_232g03018 [Ridgeia piscesae]